MILGSQLGMHKSEWNQPNKYIKAGSLFELNVDNSSKAFISEDFKLLFSSPFSSKNKCSAHSTTGADSTPYDLLQVRWRFQKNNDNGQVILFSRNFVEPELCVVAAAERILLRAKRLSIPSTNPIAVYATNSKLYNITDNDARKSIQFCAKSVYDLTSQLDISKFSNHLVRVGACVALHCEGADVLTIKTRLRWRSDSFAMYLRNMPLLAAKHTSFYNKSSVDDTVIT